MKLAFIFPEFNKTHIFKDVGMIPFHLEKHGYSIDLICRNKILEHELSAEEITVLKNFHLITIERRKGKWFDHNIIYWVIKNAKIYDAFLLFHDTMETKLLSIIIRIINKKAKIIVKLDIDSHKIESKIAYISRRPFLRKKFIYSIDKLFSISSSFLLAETTQTYNEINRLYNKARIFYMPNCTPDIYDNIYEKLSKKKEDILICVGRLGCHQKNNEALLSALEIVFPSRKWKVFFVGGYTPQFEELINNFKNKQSFQIELTGEIKSKTDLLSIYARSKLFCSTSRYEGMALSYVEALSCGTPILTTSVSGAQDTAINGITGYIIDQNNPKEYARQLSILLENDSLLETLSKNSRALSSEKFKWTPYIEKLSKALR